MTNEAEKCSTAARRFCGRGSLVIPLLVSVVLGILSAAWHHGGVLHWEVEARLPYYLSNASLLQKFYDSDYLEGGMYQARELSYFFDYIDCKFIALSVAAGHPHFLSLIQYVFLAIISLVFWRFGVEELKLERWIVLGVLLLFWTTPAVFLGGVFFRTAKIGLTLALVVLYRMIFRILRSAQEPSYRLSARTWLVCFGWAWVTTWFDRQGVFMVGVIVFILAFRFFGYREKSVPRLIGVFVAVLALNFLYNYIIDPLITLLTNGYWPDFKYQHLPWGDLLAQPFFYMTSGLSIYLDSVRFLLGDIPPWVALLAVVALVALGFMTGRKEGKPFFTAALGFVLSQTLLIWAMIVLMFLRHAALVWPDVRRTSYVLPVTSMFAMTLLLLFSRLRSKHLLPEWFLALCLSAAILGNAIALPLDRAILRNGSMSAFYQSAPALLDALRNLRNPRYPISPEIARNRVFQFFHDGYFSKNPVIVPPDKNKTPPPKPSGS